MNLDQLITFLKVYQLGSFLEAAKQMYLPQPTISHRITQLEKEMGKPLLIRGKGTVRLTEEGKVLLPYARSIANAVQEAHEAVTSVEKGAIGKLSIGCSNPFTNCILPDALDSFITVYPNISIQVRSYPLRC